jgi:hypothetical protein
MVRVPVGSDPCLPAYGRGVGALVGKGVGHRSVGIWLEPKTKVGRDEGKCVWDENRRNVDRVRT